MSKKVYQKVSEIPSRPRTIIGTPSSPHIYEITTPDGKKLQFDSEEDANKFISENFSESKYQLQDAGETTRESSNTGVFPVIGRGIDMYTGRNQTNNDPGNISDFSALFGDSRRNLTVDKVYRYNADGSPMYWTGTPLFKDLKWGNDTASDMFLTFVGGPELLETAGALKLLPKQAWKTGKHLYNAWRANPRFGAYETLKTTLPLTASLYAGSKGKQLVDAGLEAYNGQNWAQFASNLTGLPEWATEYTNPGELLGMYGGFKAIDVPWSNVERRGIEMAMRTSPAGNPITQIKYGVNQFKGDLSYSLKHPQFESRSRNLYRRFFKPDSERLPIHTLPSKTSDKLNYLLLGKKGGPNYNSFNYSDTYNGLFFSEGRIPTEEDIITNALYPKTSRLSSEIGALDASQDLGVHTNHVTQNYADKDIKVHLLSHNNNVFPETTTINREKLQDALTKLYSEEIQSTHLGMDSPIDLQNGLQYDAAGHLLELRRNPTTNAIEWREQDIWGFHPENYTKKWLSSGRSDKEKKWADFGLRVVNSRLTPHIYRTQWKNVPDNYIMPTKGELKYPEGFFNTPPLEVPDLNTIYIKGNQYDLEDVLNALKAKGHNVMFDDDIWQYYDANTGIPISDEVYEEALKNILPLPPQELTISTNPWD